MKTATFGAFVIAAASLFATGTALLNRAPRRFGRIGVRWFRHKRDDISRPGSEPAGIGERGTGQTEYPERAGSRQKGMSSEPTGIGERHWADPEYSNSQALDRAELHRVDRLCHLESSQGTPHLHDGTFRRSGVPKASRKARWTVQKSNHRSGGRRTSGAPFAAIHFSTNFFNPSSIIFQFFSECVLRPPSRCDLEQHDLGLCSVPHQLMVTVW